MKNTKQQIRDLLVLFEKKENEARKEKEVRLRESLINSNLNILNKHDAGSYLYLMYECFEFEADPVDKYVWANDEGHAYEMYPGYEFYKVINSHGDINLEAAFGF